MNDDRSALSDHLIQGMEAELVSARTELAGAAAHAAEVEAELFAVAKRLTAKEAEHEAAINALQKLHTELFDLRTELEQTRAELAAGEAGRKSAQSLPERAARKLRRVVQQ